jgi:hypothetical protein
MLQSLSMMDKKTTIDSFDVYSFTGNPSPATLQEIMTVLLNCSIQEAIVKLE